MSGIIYTKDYSVHSYEVDYYSNLFPEVILSYMQDTSMEQSEHIGAGLEYLRDRGLFWILTRYHVEIHKYPKYNDNIEVSTKAVGFNKTFAYRDFWITDKNGEKLVSANSQWLLIDGDTHKILRIPEEFYKSYGVDTSIKVSIPFNKLMQPKNSILSKTFKASRSDIDFNAHVNNARYIAWALDTMPKEVYIKNTLVGFDIVFKKEVLFDEEVYVNTEVTEFNEGLTGCHEIINHKKELVCSVNTLWK